MVNSSTFGISVIMPCYNAGSYVREAVQSVASHIGDTIPFEIILVDDGSDDDTKKIIEELETKNFPYLNIFSLPDNKGQSNARNFAVSKSRYDYLLPVDADDLLTIDPKILKQGSYPQRAVEILQSDSETAFIFSNAYAFGAVEHPVIYPHFNLESFVLRGGVPVYSVFRKDDFLSAGGYDASLDCIEDWAFTISLMNNRFVKGQGLKVKKFTEEFYLYRQHNHGQNVNSRPRNIKDFRVKMAKQNQFLFGHALRKRVKYGEQMEPYLREASGKLPLYTQFLRAKENPKYAFQYGLNKFFDYAVQQDCGVLEEATNAMREGFSNLSAFSRMIRRL